MLSIKFTEKEREVSRLAKSKEPQIREVSRTKTYTYWAPFNYPNFCVELGRTDPYVGAEFNTDGVELDVPPYGAITFVEDEPIVGVDVIGSACVPPGFVQVFAEPLEWKYPRTGVKMKVDGLDRKSVEQRVRSKFAFLKGCLYKMTSTVGQPPPPAPP